MIATTRRLYHGLEFVGRMRPPVAMMTRRGDGKATRMRVSVVRGGGGDLKRR